MACAKVWAPFHVKLSEQIMDLLSLTRACKTGQLNNMTPVRVGLVKDILTAESVMLQTHLV